MKKFLILVGLLTIVGIIAFQFQESEDQTILMSDFTLENINGDTVSINEFKGKKTLINFWATWCRPCRKEMPMLNSVYLSQDPSEFSVVGIAIDKQDKVIQFVAELGIDFPIMIGQSEAYDIMSEFKCKIAHYSKFKTSSISLCINSVFFDQTTSPFSSIRMV